MVIQHVIKTSSGLSTQGKTQPTLIRNSVQSLVKALEPHTVARHLSHGGQCILICKHAPPPFSLILCCVDLV